jgi:hypothetical protein
MHSYFIGTMVVPCSWVTFNLAYRRTQSEGGGGPGVLVTICPPGGRQTTADGVEIVATSTFYTGDHAKTILNNLRLLATRREVTPIGMVLDTTAEQQIAA